MKAFLHLCLVISLLGQASASESPKFAEDLSYGQRYSAIFSVIPDDSGAVKSCKLVGVHELTERGEEVSITPSALFVSDACRKLSHAKWQVKRDSTGAVLERFDFCLHWINSPDKAFCESRFGE
jgi:hypothetical protein